MDIVRYQSQFKKLANIISIPILVIPVVFIVYWLYISDPTSFKRRWLLMSGLATVFLPILGLYYLRIRHKIKDLDLTIIHQRVKFLQILIPMFTANFILSWALNAPMINLALNLLSLVFTSLLWLITKYWKVSVHMTVITAIVTTAIILQGNEGAWYLIPLVPLMAVHRLFLKRHSPAQVVGGLILGFSVTWGVFWAFGMVT